jgi:hypothetical protein
MTEPARTTGKRPLLAAPYGEAATERWRKSQADEAAREELRRKRLNFINE